MKSINRFVVFEQDYTGDNPDIHRVGDIFGVFTNWDKANKLCKKLQAEHPDKWYGIRQLMNGNVWLNA